ncbi:MAG: 30S ribosomal protein S2 [Erysipelotrichaceae bacterium]|nr:30S ribosomal protein S2 [Erysipelotrichaceae bacterium]
MSENNVEVIEEEKVPVVTIRKLLEAGVHFGHQTKKWNPKMAKYIYTSREGIYILDLQKTANKIEEAYVALKKIVADGGKVLFVGDKRSAQEIVEEEALRSGSFYVTQRWLGGMLTNFKTIQRRLKRLKELKQMAADGTYDLLPKKEVALLEKELNKLQKVLGGVEEMRRIPNAIFVVDPKIEHNAVAEARKLNIPVFGIVDTNNDPDDVDYVIPGNDDAAKSLKLIVSLMADAVVEAKGGQTVIAYTKDDAEQDLTLNDVMDKLDEQKKERDAAKERERAEREEAEKEAKAARAAKREEAAKRAAAKKEENKEENKEEKGE